ncbi:hypothetical protein [Sphingobacterium yanglingense]|uniref:Uncharacterized protein n=1 Tax=Sphingobacterium yanglingense TaxID=1437280 RepID=A0A4R6WLC1_9SPHI|nr:hypothetical protein [Sphingobacterium yanglingense]TDQ79578.1 hypothetical protein CLV99_1023 [Sphingobacterium yanglingense]
MWEKILAQLVAKHPGVSKAVLGLIAKKLAEKVTEENQIEGAINDFEANSTLSIKDYADFVQQQGDARVGEAKKKWDIENMKADPNNPDPEKKDENPTEMPDWAKALQNSVTTLGQQFAQKKNESTLAALIAKAKEKGIPEAYARKTIVGEEFDLDSTLSTLEAEWTEIKQANLNATVAGEKVVSGVKTTGKEVSNAIANFAKSNVEAAGAANN